MYFFTATLEELTRDLAEQYAAGKLSFEEYLEIWNQIATAVAE